MATKLLKEVKRETISRAARRPMIVSLMPGDVLSFREKGRRKTVEISLGHCFNLAKILSIENMYHEKMEEYKRKKKAGLRAKKPKKSSQFFNPFYYKSIK